MRFLVIVGLVVVLVPSICPASTGYSNLFTIDLRTVPPGGAPTAGFTWSPQTPAPGGSVSFTDTSVGSPESRGWDFNSDGVWDSTARNPSHTFSSAGPRAVKLRVTNPYGTHEITKTLTVVSTTGTPSITGVSRSYPGVFLEGTDVENIFDVTIDWQGPPGTVSFAVNGGPATLVTGDADGASHMFDMGQDFPAGWIGSTVSITPANGSGTVGLAHTETVFVYPYPTWLAGVLSLNIGGITISTTPGEVTAGIEFQHPDPAFEGTITIPDFVPYLAGELGIAKTFASIKGKVSSLGTGSLNIYGQTGFKALNQTLEGSVGGSGEFRLGSPEGLELTRASFTLGLVGSIEHEVGLVDAIPALQSISGLPVIKWFNERAKFVGSVSPSLDLGLAFAQRDGELRFDEGTGTLGLDLRVALVANIVKGSVTAQGWIAGGGSFTLGVPEPLLREVELHVEAGVEYRIKWLWVAYQGQHLCQAWCEWTPATGVQCPTPECSSSKVLLPSGNISMIEIPYTRFGRYALFSHEPLVRTKRSDVPVSVAEVSFVTNVFPGASPSLLGVGDGQLLLWEHQDINDPVLQSTEISWSYDDGTGWTTPALIADDTQVELGPVAGVDETGKVVAAWTRVKDAAFETPITDVSELPLFLTRLEAVSAVFDPVTQTWGPTSQLTDDAAYDSDLRLSATPAGGLMLTWLRNTDGELMSSETSPSDLMVSFWGSATGEWGAPSAIDSGLAGVSSHEAAYHGPDAFVILGRDPEVGIENDGVLDLYAWDGDSWTAASGYAASSVDNRLPTVVYGADGEGHVVWVRDGDMVHATLSDSTPSVVRSGSDSMAFAAAQLLTNSAGNLTLVWQEVTDNGPANIFARIYDTAPGMWSEDRRLTAEADVGHYDLNGYYGSDGILHAAYLALQVGRTTRDVDVDGQIYTFTNIPEIGATDLRLLEHPLVVDLAVDDDDLKVNPLAPEAGEDVIAEFTVHNAGDFSVGSFVVDLYVDEPAGGGTLVGTTTVSGPLAAGAAVDLQILFTMPDGAGNIIGVIDAAGDITEITETNNVARFYLNNRPPEAVVWASQTSGAAPPLTVDLYGSVSYDPDGDAIGFAWAFGDGSDGGTSDEVTHTFTTTGRFPVTLAVTDEHGAVGTVAVVITVGTPPVVPTDLTITAVGAIWADLRWTDASSDEMGFIVYRSDEGGPFLEVATVAANTISYRDADLQPDTEYTYQVAAFNEVGTGSRSNTAEAVTGAAAIFADGFETGMTSQWSSTVQ